MFADQLLVSTGQELTTMKLQTYPTNSSLRKQPFCETSPAARSEEKRLFSQATPTAHAASHNIIMSVLTMRISTLTPWMVVRNFCESKSAPSLEGKRKLSKSPRIILGKSTFAPYECSPSCDSHWSLQPVFFCFDALLATPHISEGFRPEIGIYYAAQFEVLPNPLALSTFPDKRTISLYFAVTWHLHVTMKMFPAKIFERIYDVGG